MSQYKFYIGAGVVSFLLLLLYVFLLFFPSQSDIAQTNDERDNVLAEQDQAQARLAELEGVRDNEELLQAEIAALSAVVPYEPKLQELLDELQFAADRSLVSIDTVAPGRPVPVFEDEDRAALPPLDDGMEFAAYDLQLLASGDFFEVLEFIESLESPAVSPRGFVMNNLQMSFEPGDEDTPDGVVATVSGRFFAVVPVGGIEEPDDEDDEDDVDTSEADNGLEDPDAEAL